MADIFISYAKDDRDLAQRLSAFLEARGWSVWWDRGLTAGDEFRDEIMKQLGLARAAIVIWSKASVGSSWVRSEAGRADAARKLIPVKTSEIGYQDIPPPFDVLHTEDIGNEDLIHGAVVAQLAKPDVEPSLYAQALADLRYYALLWAGSIGGGISLFVHFETVLKLSDLARSLVTHWKAITSVVWTSVFGWINVRPPVAAIPLLTLSVFFLLATLGAVARQRRPPASTDQPKHSEPLVLRTLCLIAICGIVGLGSLQPSTLDVLHPDQWWSPPSLPALPLQNTSWLHWLRTLYWRIAVLGMALMMGLFLLAFILAPAALVLHLARAQYRPSWRMFALYLGTAAILWIAMFVDPVLSIILFMFSSVAWLVAFSRRIVDWEWLRPSDEFFRPLTSRLPYFVGMLLFLLLLNEIAKLELGQYLKSLNVL